MSEQEILDILDHSKDGTYSTFIWLGDVYSFLIDSRLNIFRSDDGRWAIAAERLGYNPRASAILLEISYYGNCLTNLEEYNNQKTNLYNISVVDNNSFLNASEGEGIKSNVDFILVRGQQIKLSHDHLDYEKVGVSLNKNNQSEIRWEEVGRLLITQHDNLFRATEEELSKSIPRDLKKTLVIDEWYHKDFEIRLMPKISDEHLLYTYEFNKKLTGLGGEDYETFASKFRQNEKNTIELNKKQWNKNRPSTIETWKLIAKVIATDDITFYKPKMKPNSHWTNWKESGSL